MREAMIVKIRKEGLGHPMKAGIEPASLPPASSFLQEAEARSTKAESHVDGEDARTAVPSLARMPPIEMGYDEMETPACAACGQRMKCAV